MEQNYRENLEQIRRNAAEWLTRRGLDALLGPEYVLMPGLCDVHVHLREPGFSRKETIRTGTLAAARGGFTTVCAMPNLDPVPDSPETLAPQLDLIRRDAREKRQIRNSRIRPFVFMRSPFVRNGDGSSSWQSMIKAEDRDRVDD